MSSLQLRVIVVLARHDADNYSVVFGEVAMKTGTQTKTPIVMMKMGDGDDNCRYDGFIGFFWR